MTEPRRRTPAGRRDAELLLDGHGRCVAYPAAPGSEPCSAEDRPAVLLAALLADAAASPRHVDTAREREALQHFRAATRHAAPHRRTVRQRLAALSATAKVLSVAVGATATGGVALASASMPLSHGLRPFTSHTADAPPGHPGPQRVGTPAGPAPAPTATAVGQPASTGRAAVVTDPGGQRSGHGRGAVPGPTGFPVPPHDPVTGPTHPAPKAPPTTTQPAPEPSFDFSLPVAEPTTDPPAPRPPGFEEPPPDVTDPTPSDEVGGHPNPDPSASRTPPE